MSSEQTMNLLAIAFGIVVILTFRSFGRDTIAQRKKINKFLGSPRPDKEFGESAVRLQQILSLAIGILFIYVGITRLFS